MSGYRNLILALSTLICCTWVGLVGVKTGADLLGLATLVGAMGGTAVGAMVARGYNKKHAPDQ
jgi:hypothetical protein